MQCSFCKHESVINLRYNGTHLCESHFTRYFRKRVNLEFRNEVIIEGSTKLGVAISGGKDSSVALYETSRIFRDRRDVEIVAFTVDEGIKSYRSDTITSAESITKKLNIEHKVVRLEDRYGTTMDRISNEGKLAPCSYCGVFRRKLLNEIALDMELDYVVTGLNLDDTTQSIMMNFARGDVERLGRMGPHSTIKEGLVPRLQPLRRIPEKEVLLYAILEGIDFSHTICPYAGKALRNEFRKSVDMWEERTPGTKFSILNSFDRIKEYLPSNGGITLGTCKICGSPTSGDICKSCQFEEELRIRI